MRFVGPRNVRVWQASQVILMQVNCKPHFEKPLIIIAKGEGKEEWMKREEGLLRQRGQLSILPHVVCLLLQMCGTEMHHCYMCIMTTVSSQSLN